MIKVSIFAHKNERENSIFRYSDKDHPRFRSGVSGATCIVALCYQFKQIMVLEFCFFFCYVINVEIFNMPNT